MPVEQEIKLVYESLEAARQAVLTAGGRLVVSRRRLTDTLFDTADQTLRRGRCTLRVRRDGDRGILTFKGPIQPGPVKSREEIETTVGSADVAEALVQSLGFRRWFLAEKYREEYELSSSHIAVDETPIGVFVEIEGDPDAIATAAAALRKTPADYRLESYPRLYFEWCRARGIEPRDMTFEMGQ